MRRLVPVLALLLAAVPAASAGVVEDLEESRGDCIAVSQSLEVTISLGSCIRAGGVPVPEICDERICGEQTLILPA